MTFAEKADLDRGRVELGARRLVLHCNHYNVYLQRTIEDGLGDRAPRLLLASAMESSRALLSGIFAESPAPSPRDALARAAELFGTQGFGRLDVDGLSAMGGEASLALSHYALGWVARWGNRKTPGCFYAAGYLAGAVAVAGGLAPERVVAREARCLAMGDEICTFVVEVW